MWAQLSFIFDTNHAFDRQTDGQTAFSWLDRVACCAVKTMIIKKGQKQSRKACRHTSCGLNNVWVVGSMLALVFAGVSFSREQQASGHRAAGGGFCDVRSSQRCLLRCSLLTFAQVLRWRRVIIYQVPAFLPPRSVPFCHLAHQWQPRLSDKSPLDVCRGFGDMAWQIFGEEHTAAISRKNIQYIMCEAV